MSVSSYRTHWEGWLSKEGRVVRSWKKRYMVLENGYFRYYKDEKRQDEKGSLPIVGSRVRIYEGDDGRDIDIFERFGSSRSFVEATTQRRKTMLSNAETSHSDISEYKFRFGIERKDRSLRMAASSEHERFLWISTLRAAILVEDYIALCLSSGADPLPSICRTLSSPHPTSIEISDIHLTMKTLRSLVDTIPRLETLQSLSLRNCELSDAFVEELGPTIAENESLQNLCLADNRICNAGIAALVQDMITNVKLVSLDLSGNEISDEGAMSVADFAKVSVSLTDLNLSRNQISTLGAQSLASAIGLSLLLANVNLSSNLLGDDGVEAISTGVSVSKSIKRLDLRENNVTGHGFSALAHALMTNTSLVSLDLFGNEIDEQGAEALVRSLNMNRTLLSINIGSNRSITAAAASTLSALLLQKFEVPSLRVQRVQAPSYKSSQRSGL